MDMGEHARGNGWLSRAKHLLEGMAGPAQRKGTSSFPLPWARFVPADPGAGHEMFSRALELGRSFHDKDLQALGQLGVGTVARFPWKRGGGLQLLDEVMVSVTAGKFRPYRRASSTVRSWAVAVSRMMSGVPTSGPRRWNAGVGNARTW